MNKTRTTLYAVLAAGLLALGAFSAPVLAEGDQASQSDRREEAQEKRDIAQERRDAAQERRVDAKERADAAKGLYQERCLDSNVTLNGSEQRSCDKVKEYHGHAVKARREAHALLGAIAAIERRIGRLEVREIGLQAELDSGNFTGNRTAEELTLKIEKIQGMQDRMAERLQLLQERVDALHAKWAAVRDHVESRRHGSDDSEDSDESEGPQDDAEETPSNSTTSSPPA